MDSWPIEEALDYCLANPEGLSAPELLARFPQHSAELQSLLALQPDLARLSLTEPPPVPDLRREAMKLRIQAAAAAASTTLPHRAEKVVPSPGAQRIAARTPTTKPQPRVESRRPWWQAILRRPAVAVPVGAFVLLLLVWWGAAGSLPDSPLYSIKTSSENLMLNLSGSDESRARTHLNLASARVSDIEAMIRRDRLAQAGAALENFGYHIDRCSTLLVSGAGSARPELEPRLGQVIQACDGIFKGAGLDMSALPESLRNRIAALYGTMGAASRRVNLIPPEMPGEPALPVVTPTPVPPAPSATAVAVASPTPAPSPSPTVAAAVTDPPTDSTTVTSQNATATAPPAATATQPQRPSATSVPPTQARSFTPTRVVPTRTPIPAPPTVTRRPAQPTVRPTDPPPPPPAQPSATATALVLAVVTPQPPPPTNTVPPQPPATSTPEPPAIPTDTTEPPPPPTRGPARTNTPEPPPTNTARAQQACALSIDEVDVSCVGNRSEIRWSMDIDNSGPEPVTAAWTAELMLRPAQGSWQRVDLASGEATVPPQGDNAGGTFSYQASPNTRGLMVRVSISEARNPQCRISGSSEEMEPCGDEDD